MQDNSEHVLLWKNACPQVILIVNILDNGSLCHEKIHSSKHMCRLKNYVCLGIGRLKKSNANFAVHLFLICLKNQATD